MPLRAEFTITAPAPVPDSLGQLSAAVTKGMLTVATRRGSCSIAIDAAYADLTLALADGAKPFIHVLEYVLLLDGAPVPAFSDRLSGGKMRPRGEARVYAPCTGGENVEDPSTLGSHRARLRGTLPDGNVIESDEVQFELACEPAQPMTPTQPVTPMQQMVHPERMEPLSDNVGAAGSVAPAANTLVASRAGTEPKNEKPGSCSAGPRSLATPGWLMASAALFCGFVLRKGRRRV